MLSQVCSSVHVAQWTMPAQQMNSRLARAIRLSLLCSFSAQRIQHRSARGLSMIQCFPALPRLLCTRYRQSPCLAFTPSHLTSQVDITMHFSRLSKPPGSPSVVVHGSATVPRSGSLPAVVTTSTLGRTTGAITLALLLVTASAATTATTTTFRRRCSRSRSLP